MQSGPKAAVRGASAFGVGHGHSPRLIQVPWILGLYSSSVDSTLFGRRAHLVSFLCLREYTVHVFTLDDEQMVFL